MAAASKKNKDSSSGRLREWLQLFIIAFAALWGAYEFTVKDIIRPAQKPTALDIDASLEKVGQKESNILVRARVMAKNPTDRRIYVPAFWFIVRGYNLSDHPAGTTTDYQATLARLEGTELVCKYAPMAAAEVVAQKRIVYAGDAWWEPEDKTNNEEIFAVPEGKYDFLEMKVYYLHTRDNSVLDAPVWSAAADGAWGAQFKLKESSGDPAEVVNWEIATGSGYNWHITTLPLWAAQR